MNWRICQHKFAKKTASGQWQQTVRLQLLPDRYCRTLALNERVASQDRPKPVLERKNNRVKLLE
jgi:hypothetical protein